MNPAQLHLESGIESGDFVVRLVHEGLAGPEGGARGQFWWRALDATDLASPPILDALVTPVALYAQMQGQDLRVRGPMSREGLFNLGRLLEGRFSTTPRTVMPRLISVEPDSICDPVRGEAAPLAAVAFSGGLDSTFAAVRHGLRLRGPASYRLGALVMVHGTDAPLSDTAGFAGMLRRAEPVARRIDVPILPVATDLMRIGRLYWAQQSSPLVVSAISLFVDRVGIGIIGGGSAHCNARVGTMHPPIFDQFCSNALLRIVTDAVELRRAAKIEQLLAFPELVASMKICTGSMRGGGDSSQNCGRCEKCLATWMGFRTLGIDNPSCFAAPVDEALIANEWGWAPLRPKGGMLCAAMDDAVAYKATGSWVRRMRRVIASMPPDDSLKRLVRTILPRPARTAIRRGLQVLRRV